MMMMEVIGAHHHTDEVLSIGVDCGDLNGTLKKRVRAYACDYWCTQPLTLRMKAHFTSRRRQHMRLTPYIRSSKINTSDVLCQCNSLCCFC